MPLAIDASTPAVVQGTSTATITTASFTPPTGSLLVASQQCPTAGTLMALPSNTGGTVAWAGSGLTLADATNGSAGIWLGSVTVGASMTVTLNQAASTPFWAGLVVVVTGQAATQNGATATNSSHAGTPTATIASLTGSNSLIIGSIANESNVTVAAPDSGQSQTFATRAGGWTSAGGCGWSQYLTGMNLAAGASASITNSTTGSIFFTEVVKEILAAPSASFFPKRMPLGV